MNSRLRWMLMAVIAVLLAGGGVRVMGQEMQSSHANMPATAEAQQVSAETCADCHDDVVGPFARNPHAALDTEGLASKAGASFSCAACHGDPTAHLEAGGGADTIRTFTGPNVDARKVDEVCLTCHSTTHPDFYASPHAKAGISCLDCHSVHNSKVGDKHLLVPAAAGTTAPGTEHGVSAVCAQCHGDVMAQYQFNEHHRIEEGIVDCTSCHNPHAPQPRTLLGGFWQQQCVNCHTDKGGPFVFEHPAVMVEGCVACHDPHGGANRHQLKFQRVAELCTSCHVELPSFHSRFTQDTVCTNCHTMIHGSNFSPFFLQ
jgi:DmsE family decaheme c-type cytochrome